MNEQYDSREDTYQHISQVQYRLTQVQVEISERAGRHDWSKLQEPEKSAFDRETSHLRELTYGSEEYKQSLERLGEALQHHYAHNSHHPEHYAEGIRGMCLLDLIEMLADWKAATMRHADGDLKKSIDMNAERFGYGTELKSILHNTAQRMGWYEQEAQP